MSTSSDAALAYHEPSIVTILVQSSFLVLLNVLNWALDALLYCGLIGQILIGIAWGTPGGQILSQDAEHVVVQLGYLGLILLVFEGGLSTSFPSLKANIALSVGVAATGISVPIGFSFILSRLAGASSLQCFTAGAALCSTSLGTTFAVIRASGLASTRLGVVLTSAAMLDDVIGLVMVQVISTLGRSGASVSAVTVVRPVLVSVAFAVVAAVACRFVIRPITLALNNWRMARTDAGLSKLLRRRATALVLHTALLVALVTGASYAGTSNLFASYIAGAIISWWDSEVPHCENSTEQDEGTDPNIDGTRVDGATIREPDDETGLSPSSADAIPDGTGCPPVAGVDVFEHYYHPAVNWVLQPFFFASIGFSIPITRMFSGAVIWKGVVYAILMFIGKLLCGLWLVRFPGVMVWLRSSIKHYVLDTGKRPQPPPVIALEPEQTASVAGPSETLRTDTSLPSVSGSMPNAERDDGAGEQNPTQATAAPQDMFPGEDTRNTLPSPPKPLSLYPSAILGLAMVPRGEIGFLISSVAQSNGIFGGEQSPSESEIFLIVTWAIVLCTIVGPLCVGLLVRRVRMLETKAISRVVKGGDVPSRDVLGVWGVHPSQPLLEKS
ncbi:Cation/H+ exchanger [Pleurostoma richardsiae]|uniref:Cation/H+ exchanger n=1 Tax=Pleurostoma richardsiae TaxID=41990 RepID=A0AA38RV34_9PEZI|nr:Cation/H+ exchanger [Pleurostoma richardsiae]